MPQGTDAEVVFTVQIKPKSVDLDGYVGADADEAEAFALFQRLMGAVRDFNRTESSQQELYS